MKLFIALCAALLVNTGWAAPHQQADSTRALDQQLTAILVTLKHGDMAEARVLARQAAHSFPDSALAQLLKAELLATAAHQSVQAAATGPISPTLKALLQEARVRLQSQSMSTDSRVEAQLPSEVIQLGKDVSTLLVGDLAAYMLYQIDVNQDLPTLTRQHYIGGGKAGFGKRREGDNKTPQGLYNINGQRSDASLPDLYGAGALTLDYPNALDRQLGRTGSGIWLHGVPANQRNRPPQSSEGCVTMSNDHFIALRHHLAKHQDRQERKQASSGRPLVLLTHAVKWVDPRQKREEQALFLELFARYQQAWRKQSLTELFMLYDSLEPVLENLEHLGENDETVFLQISTVDKRDISIFRNPPSAGGMGEKEQDHVVMRLQTGTSNENQLTIYWVQGEDQQWRVVTEQWNNVNS